MRIAVCSGSFDPITLGHMDIIRRAAACFDQVYVCVSPNAEKKGQMFTPAQKLKLVEVAVLELPNVTAELYDGLLSDYAAERKATAIVRGIRTAGDFDTEYQQAHGEPGAASGTGDAAAAGGSCLRLFKLHGGAGDDPLPPAVGEVFAKGNPAPDPGLDRETIRSVRDG